jgi:hypothetical protein
MRYRRTLLILVGIAVTLAVAGFLSIRNLKPLLATFQQALQSSQDFNVYEGLPHQVYEQDIYDEERQSKDVLEIANYPFYATPLEITQEDKATLAAILAKRSMWNRFSGEKKCGGFHPDYAIEIQVNGVRYFALLCFGCAEGKLFRQGAEERYDMTLEPRELLNKYRKNRPQTGYQPD